MFTLFLIGSPAWVAAHPGGAAFLPVASLAGDRLRAALPELPLATLLVLAVAALGLLLHRRAQAAQDRYLALDSQLQAECSARAEAEAALAGSHEVLCRLVRQQESVREAERARIARDLHDELGHRLLALRVELALQQAAVRGTSAVLYDKLSQAIGTLDAALRSVRTTVGGLRPIAPGQSLRQAAERHLAEFARLHGLDYRFDAGLASEGGCDPESEVVLFRVLREALSNVGRHAQASMVRVSLVEAAGETVLRVEDDGIGPGVPASTTGRGRGVDGMRERTAALGGSLSLEAGRRGGTVLCATLPSRRLAPSG